MWYSAGKPVPFWQKQFHVPTHSDLGFPSICDSFFFFFSFFFSFSFLSAILLEYNIHSIYFVHCYCSTAQLCPTLCDLMDGSRPGLPVLNHHPELAQTHVHWVGDVIQPSHPLSSPSPPAFNLSQNPSLFQWVRWPRYWSFHFGISPSNEYSGLISFKTDWFDILPVQGTLKSFLQHHSWKASILQGSAFFMVQLTSVHDYWKNHRFDYVDLCQQSNVSAS